MTNICRKSSEFTAEEKARLLEQYRSSGLPYQEFAKEHNVSPQTMNNWIWYAKNPSVGKRRYSPTERKKIVESLLASGMTKHDFGKAWGVSGSTLSEWERLYNEFGADGLMPKVRSKTDGRLGLKIPGAVQEEIIKLKKEKPEFGLKNIRNWLFRFRGMKVSTGSIRKHVVAEGLPLAKKPKKKKRSSDRIRRFERAKPMQLWQSDITQFTLGQHWSRVYLTVFMDDHSRYIVGWRLQTRQTAELVIDAFKDAVTRFGKPEEVLTDQGRQYFAWRGKSELEKLLDKEGIKHVVSRAHHPQTLGKCERFWETVGNEFWTRAKPQDLEEARVRLKYFIDHYNHQRPHQGLDGHVPADRFFGVAEEVRLAIEKTVEQNALKMAIGELPKPPAFLIGQVGDQRIAFHGSSGRFFLTQDDVTCSAGPDGLPKQEPENRVLGRQDVFDDGDKDGGASKDNGGTRESGDQAATAAANDTTKGGGAVPSNPDAGSMGDGKPGGQGTGKANSADHSGILDGVFDEERGDGETESKTSAVLANDEPGGGRDDGGTTNPATLQEGGVCG